MTEDDFLENSSSVSSLTNSIYTTYREGSAWETIGSWVGDLCSDNALRGSSLSDGGGTIFNNGVNQFQNMSGLNGGSDFLNWLWNNAYTGIGRANTALKAIREFDGTVIVVSHDREFLDGLVTKVYEFGGGRVREHLGGIYDFLRTRQLQSLDELHLAAPAPKAAPAPEPTAGKLSYEQRKEQQRQRRKLEKAVADCEAQIGELESAVAILETQMSTAEGAADASLFERHATLKRQLETVMDEWEKAGEALEAFAAEA